MSSLVLGAVGATVGFLVGGPTGAQIGWGVGSMLGGSSPELADIHGARLSDLKVQSSTYGKAIPIYYGTARGTGEVIWSTPLIETVHVEEVDGGGKGGGGGDQEVITYTYSVSCAIAICEGPISGVRRIWANGDLIMDAQHSNPGITGRSGNLRIYAGYEDQTPDSLIEAYLGAGNVPAHRGMAYVVFENFQLEKYGNRTPNFSFEVVNGGYAYDTVYDLETPVQTNIAPISSIVNYMPHPYLDGIYLYLTSENGSANPFVLNIVDAYGFTIRKENVGYLPVSSAGGGMTYVEATDEIWISTSAKRYQGIHIYATAFHASNLKLRRYIRPMSGGFINVPASPGFGDAGMSMYYDKRSHTVLFLQGASQVSGGYNSLDPITEIWQGYRSGNELVNLNWFIGKGTEGNKSIAVPNFHNFLVFFVNNKIDKVIPTTYNSPTSTYDPNREKYAWWDGLQSGTNLPIFKTAKELSWEVETYIPTGLTIGGGGGGQLVYISQIDKYLWSVGKYIYKLNADTFALEYRYTAYDPGVYGAYTNAYDFMGVNGSSEHIVGRSTLSGQFSTLFQLSNRYTTDPKILASTVTDICRRCDLSPTEIDVTDLEPYDLQGYIISKQMTGRTALEALQKAFFFDSVESDQ